VDRNGLLIFVGLLAVAGAVLFHANSGRYTIAYSAEGITAKLDTRTGEAWVCGLQFDGCIPMTLSAVREADALRKAHASTSQKSSECAMAKNAEECSDALKRAGKNPFDAFDYIWNDAVPGGHK
jgi:hypothetical protein